MPKDSGAGHAPQPAPYPLVARIISLEVGSESRRTNRVCSNTSASWPSRNSKALAIASLATWISIARKKWAIPANEIDPVIRHAPNLAHPDEGPDPGEVWDRGQHLCLAPAGD
jgi:hypothetical protein